MNATIRNAFDAREDLDGWGDRDDALLGTGRRAVPDFPVAILGPWTDWVRSRAAAASAPVDYVAVPLLAAVGGLLANVRWPLAGAGWSEPPILWACIVGSPSSGKSPAMDPVMALLQHAEEHLAKGFEDVLAAYDGQKVASKLAREAWENEVKYATAEGIPPPPRPASAQEPQKPERPRVRVDDATSERLGALAAALPRGFLLVRDELAGWFGSFDRYGGGGADRALALQMYGGRQHRVDRVKHPEGHHVRHLSIGVVGGTQPDKLNVITQGDDDGFASRLLWAWPDALPSFRLARERLNDAREEAAFLRLADLAMGADEEGNAEPKRIRLTEAAEDCLEAFARQAADGSAADASIGGTLGKARGHVLRLACIIEHLWWCGGSDAEPTAISEDAVLAAAGLIEGYFLPMARRVFGDAAIPIAERSAMLILRRLRSEGLDRFNARDLRRAMGGSVREAKAMDAACECLLDANLVRPVSARRGGTPGRSSKDFLVNPAIHGRAA